MLDWEIIQKAFNASTARQVHLPSYVTNVVYVSLDHPALMGYAGRIPSPFVVPSGCCFVLGDSTNSNDSRMWGALPRTNILRRGRGKWPV